MINQKDTLMEIEAAEEILVKAKESLSLAVTQGNFYKKQLEELEAKAKEEGIDLEKAEEEIEKRRKENEALEASITEKAKEIEEFLRSVENES